MKTGGGGWVVVGGVSGEWEKARVINVVMQRTKEGRMSVRSAQCKLQSRVGQLIRQKNTPPCTPPQ